MARKLKIMENEKHPLDDLKNEKSLKYVKNEKCTLKDLEADREGQKALYHAEIPEHECNKERKNRLDHKG